MIVSLCWFGSVSSLVTLMSRFSNLVSYRLWDGHWERVKNECGICWIGMMLFDAPLYTLFCVLLWHDPPFL